MDKNKIADVIEEFAARNIKLWTEDGKLKYKAANGTLSKSDIEILKQNKEDIIEFLANENIKIVPDEEHAYEPFALTEIQQAYMLGRSNAFDYGGVACHIYMELEYDELDPIKTENIWNEIIARHPMLHAKMSVDGYQTIVKNPRRFNVGYRDLRKLPKDEQLAGRKKIKAELDHKVYDPESAFLYTVIVSRSDENSIMHVSIEFLVADWLSIWNILSEFESRYFTPEKELSVVDVTFRDYQIAEQKLRQGMKYHTDRQYWLRRIETMPKAPELPVLAKSEKTKPRFERNYFLLESGKWEKFKEITRHYGVTPTAAVMTAYGMCLAKWSQNKKFCLNLSILNRLQLHENVNNIVGDFTASSLLEMDCSSENNFAEKAKAVNIRLFEDLDHRLFNGVQVLRELQKIHGSGELMPYVFTSAIGLLSDEQSNLRGKMNSNGISQTPQAFLDCQAMDTKDGLNINLDSRVGIFPEGLISDFKNTFHEFLAELSENENLWTDRDFEPNIPEWQRKEREEANNTNAVQEEHLLHEYVMNKLRENPEKLAVADAECEWSRRELLACTNRVKSILVKNNIGRGDIVAVAIPKSRWQIAACLGILESGAAYVPLDVAHAKKRSETILLKTSAKAVITLEKQDFDAEGLSEFIISELPEADTETVPREENSIDDLAYIIFTSGSTGEPKGVKISHKAAVNTIEAINRMYSVNENDRVFQISQLNFDLSVYDLFGVPSAGGAVIIPDSEQYKNPAHWEKMISKYGVTIWNSVPALMQMFMIYIQFGKKSGNIPLRLAMLSGDWIPVELPDQLMNEFENIKVVSLGGATEGGIWSIYHDCIKGEAKEKQLCSIPYGRPLPNQGYMALDSNGKDCPVWVAGDLYITGKSLADGYWKDEELTRNAFINYNGEIIYKTGDRGCYHPNGEIEFLGRADNQVKLRGHRIELGEIEAVYKKYFEIQSVSCVICEKSGEKVIAAVYIPKNSTNDVLENRDSVLKEWLPNYMIPSYDIKVDTLPLTANGKVDVKAIKKIAEESISNIGNKKEKSSDLSGIEAYIAKVMKEVMKIDSIGSEDDFYELGANSLILSRAAGKLNQEVESSISFEEYLVQILNEPKIRALAEFIDSKKAVSVNSQENAETSENNIRFESNENSENLCIVFENDIPENISAVLDLSEENRIFIGENYNSSELIQLIKKYSFEKIAVIAADSRLAPCLELSSELLENDLTPESVIVIESGDETETELETPYMGDMKYILTVSSESDADEIREILGDFCYGEIEITAEKNIKELIEV